MMNKVQSAFQNVFELITSEIGNQRDIHNDAFGKPNAAKVAAAVEKNNKALKAWLEALQRVHNEMDASGLWGTPSAEYRFVANAATMPTTRRSKTVPPDGHANDWTGKKPVSFSLLGENRSVKSWKELVIAVLELLHEYEPQNSASFPERQKYGKRVLFSPNKDEIKWRPMYVKGLNLWLETNYSAKDFRQILAEAMSKFGCSINDITIETRESGGEE